MLVIANWKMNGDHKLVTTMAAALRDRAEVLTTVDVAICPPAVLLPAWRAAAFYEQLHLGAQDCNEHAGGAHTGEHSLDLLAEAGAQMILVGHSERRQSYGDNATRVAAKLHAVLATNTMRAVLCVGESASERELDQTFTVIETQLESALQGVNEVQCERLVVAYEPVWAIGTGETATPQQAQAVHKFIRAWLTQRFNAAGTAIDLLYGGSVKADNAEALFAESDIDGGLIGGASLQPEQFLAICTAAATRSN